MVKRDARRRVVDTARRRVDGPPARVETLRRRSQGAGGSTTADMERLQATCRERLAPLARRGRARLDFTQNAVNKTLVAPYAVRPVAGAAVSAPITWAELDDPDLRSDGWNIKTIIDRVGDRGDLFAGALELEQDLPELG